MPDEPQYQRCPHCGAQNTQSAEFCTLCLKRFKDPEQVTVERVEEQAAAQASRGAAQQEKRAEEEAKPAEAPAEEARPSGEMWADEALDPSLRFDLSALHYEPVGPRMKIWVRLAVVVSVVFVVLSLGLAIVGTLSYQTKVKRSPAEKQEPAPPQNAPSPSPQPAQTQQPPVQPQGSPQEHPDLTFTAPTGWRVEGNAANITLVESGPPGSNRVDVSSWLRQGGGPYGYANGPLKAAGQPALDQEIASVVSDYLVSSGVDNVTSLNYSVGGQPAQGAEGKDAARNRYWIAIGLVHGQWTYFILAQGAEKQALEEGLQTFLQSVQFRS